jgi:dual-specificity kinase
MEHTIDSVGGRKEVIVIDDSESPMGLLPKKRTRAVAAQEAAANGSDGLGGKKRKVETASDAGSIKNTKTKLSVGCSVLEMVSD